MIRPHQKPYIPVWEPESEIPANADRIEGELESQLADLTGSPYVLTLQSGTAALHLALKLAGVKAGDQVWCQTFTFAAPAFAVQYCQASLVFLDSEAFSWNLDPELLKESLEKNAPPKAIIVNHSYGFPAKILEIRQICREYGIFLLEDAAGAMGTMIQGKMAGTFGDAGVISFNLNKIITGGGGGALLLNKEVELNYYHHLETGFNYRINPYAALHITKELKNLPSRLKKLNELADFYRSRLHPAGIHFPYSPSDVTSNYWMNPVLFPDEKIRQDMEEKFQNYHIECRRLWNPLHLQPVFSGSKFFGGNTAEALFRKGLLLPSGPKLDLTDAEDIVNLIITSLHG